MSARPSPRVKRLYGILSLVLIILVCGIPVQAQEPAVYLNFDEGSGSSAQDSSGHGNAATLHNTSRIESGGCSRALSFENPDSYVSVPYRLLNHPKDAITVSAWFYTSSYTPAPLVSAYHNGGYRLGFDDGNDLWWTLHLEDLGDVSVPVHHENIALHEWHQVTGTYDGTTLKIYLDGILRNQANATGSIRYEVDNYVILGAEAGASETPAPCPHPFAGGLDEVRIYPAALTYGQVMDDRFRCIEGAAAPAPVSSGPATPATCHPVSGALRLGTNETAERVLSFPNRTVNGTWAVSLTPGSVLSVRAYDSYMRAYPDAWYLEIANEEGKPARTVAFPNRNNAPAEATLPSGNATVTVKYFSGNERFPATALLRLESRPPVPARLVESRSILENPIIVIYSASWATLVAILLVMIWLRWRKKAAKTESGGSGSLNQDKKKL